MSLPSSPAEAGRATLGRIAEALGPETVSLLSRSASAGLGIGGPRIWDPADPDDLAPGDLVLAVNVPPGEAAAAIAQAGNAGASAIAFKGDGSTLAAAIRAADERGVGLVAVAPGVTWDQLYGLIRNAASAVAPVDQDQTPIGDLFALSNAMAAIIGGAVTIEDPHGNLLAYSNLDQPIDEPRRQTILGRRNPSAWSRRLEDEGFYRQLSAANGVIRIQDPQGKANDRVATLIKAGAEVLGSIWVVEGDQLLGTEAADALRDATPLAALHLLRHRAFHDSTRRERGRILRSLLEGGSSEIDHAEGLGIDAGSQCVVVAFHLIAVDDDVELAVSRSRVIDAITMACEAFRRRVVCTWIGQTIYALFPAMTPASSARLAALAQDICSRMGQGLGVQVLAGISAARPGLSGARECRDEADRVVRVLREAGAGDRVADIGGVRIASILLTLGDVLRGRPDLRLPGVAAVAAHDADHAKTYMTTLRAFIDAGGNVSTVAKGLGVHPNTIRYRVRRIEEISGLDLSDPTHRLVVALELLIPPAPG